MATALIIGGTSGIGATAIETSMGTGPGVRRESP
jgi:hypothetical protein